MTTKRIIRIIFIFLSLNSFGQKQESWKGIIFGEADVSKKEYKDSLIKYDFSSVWTSTDNALVRGFIGNNYERIRMKIISVVKDSVQPDIYNVTGKSLVKTNVCQYHGTIKIKSIRLFPKIPEHGCEDPRDKTIRKEGILIAKYQFMEDSIQTHSGIFEGILTSSWYLNKKSQINYDDLDKCADSYCNNLFSGTWRDYQSKSVKKCNWGDFRIADSDSLDVGDGAFYPNEKYLKNGWQTYRDAYSYPVNKLARQEEERVWWEK